MKALRFQLGVILSSLSFSALASAQAVAPAASAPAPAAPDAVAPAPESAPADAPPAAVQPEPAPAPAPAPEPVAVPVAEEPVAPPPPPGPPSFKIEIPDGSIKLGILAQPQLQVNSSDDKNIHGSKLDLMVRRARVLIGGTVLKDFDYFFDTDFANILQSSVTPPAATAAPGTPGTTTRAIPGMNITDIFFTYHPIGDVFKVDAGYMLPAAAHNAVQGAGTLYGLDYFSSSFAHQGAAFGGTTGRDAGLQLRGLVIGGHLEYRLGLFQGARRNPGANPTHVDGSNFFRTAGRIQVNILDAEPGFFYAGTYLGKKKILSAGGFFDFQDKYRTFGGDVFADLPIGPGVLTGQVNFVHRDAGSAQLQGRFVKANVLTGEIGYNIAALKLSPILKLDKSFVKKSDGLDSTTVGGGLAFWPYGHTSNIKAFFSHTEVEGPAKGSKNFTLQWQLYFF